MMLAALALMARGDTSRELWLYDTFEGMSEPGAEDRSPQRRIGRGAARAHAARRGRLVRGRPGRRARQPRIDRLSARAHPLRRRQGRGHDPGARCRRAWRCCASTPTGTSRPGTSCSTSIRCSRAHGILLIDDYGHWQGARQAVDEYFAAQRRAGVPAPRRLHGAAGGQARRRMKRGA